MNTKAEGVKDIVKWMKAEIKQQKIAVERAEAARSSFGMYQDCGAFYVRQVDEEKAKLEMMVSWMISTEKYMKKLQHEAREQSE